MQRPSPASSSDGGLVPRELAARLLESHYPYRATGESPLLFAGSLPEDVPFRPHIPEGFVLVGSARFDVPGSRRMVEVVLDTTLPAARVRDTYRALLSDEGWEEENLDGPGGGGFARGPRGFLISLGRTLGRSRRAAVDVPGLSTVFRDARRQTLIVSAEERRRAPTDVRLRLLTSRGPLHRRHRNDPEALFVLPILTPPPHARVSDETLHTGHLAPPFAARTTGGSYGGHGWEHDGAYSFAALESDLDLPSITVHYADQLEATGWSGTGEGRDGPQAWNTWAFSDNEGHPWEAALTILHLPRTPRRYLLNLRADRTPIP